MKLFNTLSSSKEELKPIYENKIGMYTCGPTVYDVAHIGNLRKYICDDLLYRALIFGGYQVKRVMNITDVDDKTIKRSGGDRKKIKELTEKYEESFFKDLQKLNIVKPGIITRATEYIDEMVNFIEDLLKKGFAYRANDGSIYFSISKFKEYGQLSKLENREVLVGARVSQDEYDKENPSDFALWKAWDKVDGEVFWETTLGKGRPGWHIECSAMSTATLGETIDIHTGGVDNIFPHHENEIAQSEARSGKKFVNIWVHNEHLLVNGKKMAKSVGNFYTLANIEEKGFSPLDFRYLMIGAHYRSKINFTWEGLDAAKNARERLKRLVADLTSQNTKSEVDLDYCTKFQERINDDVNIPDALAIAWELMRNQDVGPGRKLATILKMDEILGLELEDQRKLIIPKEVKDLAEERRIARENKNFAESDRIRDRINTAGWQIEDLPNNEYKITK